MRTPTAFLKTRIARRVFALFLMCAVVPTALLAIASYWTVTRELRTQAETQLTQAAKVSGTLLLSRLHDGERALDETVERIRRYPATPAGQVEKLEPLFSSVSIGAPGQPGRALLGPSLTIPSGFGGSEVSQLQSDRPVLLVEEGSPEPRILLVRTLLPGQATGPLMVAQVSPAHLWGGEGGEPLAPPETDFCVYPKSGSAPLHCSDGGARRVGPAVDQVPAGVVGGSSDLFLGFEFAASAWSLRLARPVTAYSAPIQFRRSVLLTLALGVWLVVFASNVLLRHRLDPVAKLQEATRRVADGDFSASVSLSTKDEFEELAQAFNTMAGRIRDQFALLRALHEVDREALVLQNDVEVARAAVAHFPRLMAVEEALIALRVPSADDPESTVVWGAGLDGSVERRRLSIPRSAFAELERQPDCLVVQRFAPQPAFIRACEPKQVRAHLLLPLLEQSTCFAAVLLTGRSNAVDFPEQEVRRARQVADQLALALANSRLLQRLNAMSWGTLQALARSIDAVSPWTAGHSERVTRVGLAIGRQLELAPDLIDQLHRGGLLHDVGKVGVPASILDKPGKLDDAEFATIRAHPVIGARILEPIQAYEDVIAIVRHHHERFDGTGYPDRLAGRAIPYLARVLSVADVYDALVSRRPYREGWAHEAAVEYIGKRAGMEFDPEVVSAFLELVAGPAWAAAAATLDSSSKVAADPEERAQWTT